jgi:alkylresorcinol/alkylpyrone synthase
MRAAKILSIGRGLSEHYYDQDALLSALKALWGHQFHNPARLEQLHRNVLVGGRHLAFPIERYQALESFTDCNRAFIDRAVDLGARGDPRGL